ncbi:hypothetical protein HJC05_19985 [Rhizobium sp. NLR9a]|uniref:hypothetical protein n=1 Tax=unclassified Rhizobium TaxID=2613769 RepID=UPI001C831874|nr:MULTISPECIES: hypothetical protein [unclassified Rhizobium]MBX5216471.1 hypothetical protein [Rhizobium sp. NLR9a]MBX5277847.1 hypothetical protein [Rhizobium sp. NLR13a]
MAPYLSNARRHLAVLSIAMAGFFAPSFAQASLPGLIVTDIVIGQAVDKFGGLVDRARDAALAVEGQTNEHVKERLEQVDKIVSDTVSKINALEKQASLDAQARIDQINAVLKEETVRINDLEEKFMADVSKKIREVQCTSDVVMQEQMKDLLGRLGVFLGTNTLIVTPAVLFEGETERCYVLSKCRVQKSFQIYTPFSQTYGEVKDYLLKERIGKMDGRTPVESVVDTYSLIADLAKRATCHTEANNMTYENEYVNYSSMVRQWNSILTYGMD